MPSCYWCNDSFGHRPDCPVLEVNALRARVDELSRAYAVQGLAIEELTAERDTLRARVAELEEGTYTAMQLIEGGFDSAAYEALEALNAHK